MIKFDFNLIALFFYSPSLLCSYGINQQLSDLDEKMVTVALYFHPRSIEKIGSGPQEIKVSRSNNHIDIENGNFDFDYLIFKRKSSNIFV